MQRCMISSMHCRAARICFIARARAVTTHALALATLLRDSCACHGNGTSWGPHAKRMLVPYRVLRALTAAYVQMHMHCNNRLQPCIPSGAHPHISTTLHGQFECIFDIH